MKKIITASVLVLAMGSPSAMADTAVGFTSGMGFGVAAQFDGKYNLSVGNSGVAMDYIFKSEQITKDKTIALSWYIAAGAAYHWRTGYISGKDQVGAIDIRVPVGLDMAFAKVWDAFLEADPALEINDGLHFGYDAALGVRYHF